MINLWINALGVSRSHTSSLQFVSPTVCVCVSEREREKQKIEFLCLIFFCELNHRQVKTKQSPCTAMWYSLHSLDGWSPFLLLFIYLFRKKTLCSWLTLCFGCISVCVGWENVAEVASGKLVRCCFWQREPMGSLQPTCGCVSVVCKITVFTNLRDLDFSISSSSSQILQNLFIESGVVFSL